MAITPFEQPVSIDHDRFDRWLRQYVDKIHRDLLSIGVSAGDGVSSLGDLTDIGAVSYNLGKVLIADGATGFDAGFLAHSLLTGIGIKTHVEIDSHIIAVAPHTGHATSVHNHADIVLNTIHRASSGIDHSNVRKCNFDAIAAPTPNDDVGIGYTVGSFWYDVTGDKGYVCLDATVMSAVWLEVGAVGVTIEEEDGAPIVNFVSGIKVTDGTLTDLGANVVSIETRNARDQEACNLANGLAAESYLSTVASDGFAVTLTLVDHAAGTIEMVYHDGILPVLAPYTIVLTHGTDIAPQMNYVYVRKATQLLTVSIVEFPVAEEYLRIGTFLVQSAVSAQIDGIYILQAMDDHTHGTTDMGHVSEINTWIRRQNATWVSGVTPTLTITPQVGADDVIFTNTAGVVYHLHDETFPAFVGTPAMFVVNDPAVLFKRIINLNTITDYSGASGAIPNNTRFSIVIWGVCSDTTGDCHLMVNLPAGGYLHDESAINDPNHYSNYDVPDAFRGTGFLIARYTLHLTGGDLSLIADGEEDLRGMLPNLAAGGAAGITHEFPDDHFRVFDNDDPTKLLAFEVSGVTAGNTRTLAVQDVDGTICLDEDLDAHLLDLANPHSVDATQVGPTVEEDDGAPSVDLVNKIIVPKGWLDDNGGGVVEIDPFDFAETAWGHDGFWGGALANRWISGHNGAGSSNTLRAPGLRGQYRLNCGTVLFGAAWLSLTNAGYGVRNFDPDHGIVAQFRAKTAGALLAIQAVAVGFGTDIVEGTEGIWFVAQQGINGGLYQCRSYNAAGIETTNTTLAPSAWRTLRIVATGASIKFYIDKVLKATHTTRLVHDPCMLTMFTAQGGEGGTAVNFDIDDVFWQVGG